MASQLGTSVAMANDVSNCVSSLVANSLIILSMQFIIIMVNLNVHTHTHSHTHTYKQIDARSSSSPSGSPKHRSDLTLSDVIEDSPGGVSSSGSSSSAESSTSSSGSSPSYREVPGFSAREVLHRFPATYIGEAVAGKLHSIDDVIQKVLVDSRPTLSKELVVCLSLAEVKFVEMRGEEEVVCMTHETSRIRAIGVYSQDKRFMGYIIKEEGKPLMSYVLRCNSAALMVQLVSFLRQSCQLTFYQRGGSFYDELAADDADDCDYIIDVRKKNM